MASLADMKLPDISAVDFSGQDAKQIKSYLYQLNEQLRYLLGNIGEDQLSTDVKDQLDLTKLLINALGGGTTINITSGGQAQPWSPSDMEQLTNQIKQIGDRLGEGSTSNGGGGFLNVQSVAAVPTHPDPDTIYLIQGAVLMT